MTAAAPEPPGSGSSSSPATDAPLPARVRRTLELVYRVEGVTAARVWHWPGNISVGVRPGFLSGQSELLSRVEDAVSGLREPGETWDFGLLDSPD